MTCPGFTPIGKDGSGYCQVMYHHVYPASKDDLCLCDYCHTDADGKRYLDPDVYFHGNDQVGLHSRDAAKLAAMNAAAEKMPLATPRPEQCHACYREDGCALQYPGCNLFNSKSGMIKTNPVKAPAKRPAPAKKKVSLFDFKG